MAKAAAPPFAAPTTPPGTKHAREAVERALAEIENFRQANPEAANAITSQLRKYTSALKSLQPEQRCPRTPPTWPDAPRMFRPKL